MKAKLTNLDFLKDEDVEAYMKKQPKGDIFAKHVGLSLNPSISGWQGNLWVFDGKAWKQYDLLEETDKWEWLQQAMRKHATQIQEQQWEFPEGFVFECFKEGDE